MSRKLIRMALGVGVAALLLWLVLKEVRVADITHVLSAARLGWVVVGMIVLSGGYACRIERWRLMLMHENPKQRWSACAGPFLASFAANNVLPFRVGDLLRIFGFNHRLEVGPGVVAATLFVERMLDLLMILILLFAALTAFDLHGARYIRIGSVGILCLAMCIVVMLLFSHHLGPILIKVIKVIASIWPRMGARILAELERSLITLKTLSRGATMLKIIVLSALAWGLEALVYVVSAVALPAILSPSGGYLALPLSALATMLPSTPGYLGTFEFFVVQAMTALGNGAAAATAYAMLVHFVIWLPLTLVGGLCWLLMSRDDAKPLGVRT